MGEPLRVSLVGLSNYSQGVAQPCLALYSLRGYARTDQELQTRVDITVHDLTLDRPIDGIHQLIRASRPDVVGLSCFLWSTPHLLLLAQRIKEGRPECMVFLGGPDVGPRAQRILSAHASVDGIVVGEGEEPFRLLLRSLTQTDASDWSETPGLVCRSRGVITENALPEPLPLACIPYLRCDPEFLGRFPQWIEEVARGCSWNCAYCAYSVNAPRRRVRPIRQVLRSWQTFSRQGGRLICLLDPGINQDRRRFRAMLRWLTRHGNLTLFGVEINLEQLHPEDVPLMAGRVAGVVAIGLQSTNTRALREARRRFDPEVFRTRAALLREHGVDFGLDIIYGLPGDSFDSFKKTLNDAYLLRPRRILCFPLQVLPGSAFWQEPHHWGLLFDPEPPYLVRRSNTFSEEDLLRAEKLANAHDIFQELLLSPKLAPQFLHDSARGPAELLEAFVAGAWRGKEFSREELQHWADPGNRPALMPLLETFLDRYSPEARQLLRD